MIIQLDQSVAYTLAVELLSQPHQKVPHTLGANGNSLEVHDPAWSGLLALVARRDAAVLPVFGVDRDEWCVAGTDRYSAHKAFSVVSRFVIPTYGQLPAGAMFADFYPFAEKPSRLHDAARAWYAGYVAWESPPHYRAAIMHELRRWIDLDRTRPELKLERLPTYGDLLSEFNSALTVAGWEEAGSALARMRQLHHCTADNLQYLHVQLLARQGRWLDIWNDPDFHTLAKMPVPRAVRCALLTSFHHAVLLEAEQRGAMDEAVECHRQMRHRLGILLSGRFQIPDSAVVRVFGYEAVIAGDGRVLDDLLGQDNLDTAATACLESLRQMLPAEETVRPPAIERLRLAMLERDYDAASEAAGQLDDPLERTLALLRIGFRHHEAAKLALAAYDALSKDDQVRLESQEPAVDTYLERALDITAAPQTLFGTWTAWFGRLFEAPDDLRLSESLDYLITLADDRDWTHRFVDDVTAHLERLVADHENLLARPVVRRALHALVDLVLGDNRFMPTQATDSDLYSALYMCLILMGEANSKSAELVLRLAEAILRGNPSQVETVFTDLTGWFARPTPALDASVLEAFDLLAEYGLPGPRLSDWYRSWLEHWLALPRSIIWDRASQEVWLSFGEWIQPGEDLLTRLRTRLMDVSEANEIDPVSLLPQGYRIAVFTLQRNSAERVRHVLLRRNPSLDVRMCHDTDMSPQVEDLARNADLAIVVSSCITHAITYGIRPLLQRNPIYPPSRGTVGMLRAVETFATNLHSSGE